MQLKIVLVLEKVTLPYKLLISIKRRSYSCFLIKQCTEISISWEFLLYPVKQEALEILTIVFFFSADVLLSEIIPKIITHVQSFLSSTVNLLLSDVFESNPGSQFWLNLMQTIKDSYAVERMSEQLLQHLATGSASDVEAYWILWLLFHRIFEHQASVRSVNDICFSFSSSFIIFFLPLL